MEERVFLVEEAVSVAQCSNWLPTTALTSGPTLEPGRWSSARAPTKAIDVVQPSQRAAAASDFDIGVELDISANDVTRSSP